MRFSLLSAIMLIATSQIILAQYMYGTEGSAVSVEPPFNFEPYQTTLLAIIAATSGIISIFVIMMEQRGFMKLKLNCITVKDDQQHFIVSKTCIENTSRIPIKIYYCGLLIYPFGAPFEEILKELDLKEVSDRFSNHSVLERYSSKNNLDKLKKYKNISNKFVLENLAYYYEENYTLGSFEILASKNFSAIQRDGIYSVVFLVFGNKVPFLRRSAKYRKIPTYPGLRFLREQVIVTNSH